MTVKKFPSPDEVKKAVRVRVDGIVEEALCKGNLTCEIENTDAWVVPDVVKDLEAVGWTAVLGTEGTLSKNGKRTLRISLPINTPSPSEPT